MFHALYLRYDAIIGSVAFVSDVVCVGYRLQSDVLPSDE